MINIQERRKEIIEWHFPEDEKNPTIFHLKWLSGTREAYLRVTQAESGKPVSLDQWRKELLTNSIVKIENWESENGKSVTLSTPEQINKACDLLSENEIYLLIAAIRREGKDYKLGLLEKN